MYVCFYCYIFNSVLLRIFSKLFTLKTLQRFHDHFIFSPHVTELIKVLIIVLQVLFQKQQIPPPKSLNVQGDF